MRSQPGQEKQGGRWTWRTKRASRCSNAYLISRSGMLKMLRQLPAWCSLDWMMHAAKYANVDESSQTKVYFIDPPVFVEGSKIGMMKTTIET
mmetsp:Transcript_28011/g.90871  ORF Transcript_28011/g.90871 Transcript_28011/m.90871 type:complete len:92 (-) Transcript_28011:8-283(-)